VVDSVTYDGWTGSFAGTVQLDALVEERTRGRINSATSDTLAYGRPAIRVASLL
jgi:hypothetical protein